ncbi:MAG TPA: hypothetical protein VIX82_00705 [Solirubrobacteraceae bacterium]
MTDADEGHERPRDRAGAAEEALARKLHVPARWYSDPEIDAFELERIFSRSWQYAGPLGKLEQPGDHIVSQIGHVPVVITCALRVRSRAFTRWSGRRSPKRSRRISL